MKKILMLLALATVVTFSACKKEEEKKEETKTEETKTEEKKEEEKKPVIVEEEKKDSTEKK